MPIYMSTVYPSSFSSLSFSFPWKHNHFFILSTFWSKMLTYTIFTQNFWLDWQLFKLKCNSRTSGNSFSLFFSRLSFLFPWRHDYFLIISNFGKKCWHTQFYSNLWVTWATSLPEMYSFLLFFFQMTLFISSKTWHSLRWSLYQGWLPGVASQGWLTIAWYPRKGACSSTLSPALSCPISAILWS